MLEQKHGVLKLMPYQDRGLRCSIWRGVSVSVEVVLILLVDYFLYLFPCLGYA